MNLREIAYFLAVVEEGSISRAAVRLHLTQPPLSLAIAKLERELDVTLLIRTYRGIEPTEAGHYLVGAGRRLLNEAERIEDRLRALGAGRAGRVRIATGPIMTWDYLPPRLAELNAQAPDVEVELVDPPSFAIAELVRRGEVDLGIAATADVTRIAHRERGELRIEPIAQMGLYVGVPRALADRDLPLPLTDLADQTWLLPQGTPEYPGVDVIAEDAWRAAGMPPPRVRWVATPQTAVPLVAAGMGISLLPQSFQNERNGVYTVQSDPPVRPLTVAAIWTPMSDGDALVQRMLAILRDDRRPRYALPPSAGSR
ncbi:LysR family transcriptional regulator [Epidermidibacterium keratini]|uniref:LysR family transcriptional regulator n=1 Tax=Epidermidibacterium keratini TaxID=1891644 RepID=A0A7L4YRH6_9ACTN|nr:LysR family transcriptional regulator [Epidermidibacterium keratini]QHC01379.1 LysR family transcriptional regulator [Epidermidibacterium keratini]